VVEREVEQQEVERARAVQVRVAREHAVREPIDGLKAEARLVVLTEAANAAASMNCERK
jgi:hypothetical protein